MSDDLKFKRKRGPTPQPDKRRTIRVNVYLDDKEASDLDLLRSRVGLQRSDYMRLSCFANLPPQIPELNKEAWLSLSRLSSNLNQLSKNLNSRIEIDINELSELLSELRNTLIGVTQND